MALNQQVASGYGIGPLIVILTVHVQFSLGVMSTEVLLRFSEHAAGAASRVEQFAHSPRSREQFVIVDEQQIDHQPDDLARGEVIAGGLVGQFVEAPDEVLEDQPHLDVVYFVGVEIDITELGDDKVENVGLVHLLDFVVELEEFEDAAHVRGETFNVARQVLVEAVGIALEFLERERGVIVETLT